jgi:hypothetical protein
LGADIFLSIKYAKAKKFSMKSVRFFVFFTLLLFAHATFAQKRSLKEEINFEQLVEEFFPMQEDDVDYSDAYEILFQMLAEPIDLNNADADELKALFLISQAQCDALLQHRERFGKFLSIYELQAVQGFSLEDIHRILPFVSVRETNLEKTTFCSSDMTVLCRKRQVFAAIPAKFQNISARPTSFICAIACRIQTISALVLQPKKTKANNLFLIKKTNATARIFIQRI